MSITKKLWETRAEARGGIFTGLRDRAFISTRTHTQWTTPAWGGTRDLVIELDGGVASQTLSLSPSTVYTLDEIVALINTAFSGVGTVGFAYRAGRLQIRSTREGIGSRVNVSGSDSDVLDLFEFDNLDVTGRQIEDAQENVGVEDNPAGTRFIATGEQHIKEVLNRHGIYTSTILDQVQGYLNAYYAQPDLYTVTAPDTRTVDDLGGVRNIQLNGVIAPQIGEVVTGQVSAVQGVVANFISGVMVLAPVGGAWSGNFSIGEDLDGTLSGVAFGEVAAETVDSRIAAVKMPGRAYVGGFDSYGLTQPDADDYERIAQLSIYQDSNGEGVPRSVDGASTGGGLPDPTRPGVVQREGQPSRVKYICLGVPDDPHEPSNIYNHQGVTRQAAVDVDRWTRNRIYPNVFSAAVRVGDVAVITGSEDAGVALNNGRYSISAVNATEGYYEIGPSRPADTGAGLPEDTVADAEIFVENGTVGVQVTVLSPSYILEEGRVDSLSADSTAWMLMEDPVDGSQTLTLSYYTVVSMSSRAIGAPEFESPWSRYLRARVDTIDERLKRLQFGGPITGVLLDDPSTRPLGTYEGSLAVKAYDEGSLYTFTGKSRHTAFNEVEEADSGPLGDDAQFKAGLISSFNPGTYVGDVPNMTNRHVRADAIVVSYDTRTAPVTHGTLITGSTSGAVLRFLSDQSATQMLVERVSGTPLFPETFTFASGVESITQVAFQSYYGFRFDLPWVLDGNLASVASGGVNVTFPANPPSLQNVRQGDLFEALSGPMVSDPYRPRVSSIDTSDGLFLNLQVPQPYAGVVDNQWKITPNLGSQVGISYNNGGNVKAGSPFIILKMGPSLPDLLDYGVMPGDLIRCTSVLGGVSTEGTGQEYIRIKSVVLSPAAQTDYIVEVHPDDVHKLSDATDLPWEIVIRQQRVQTVHPGAGPLLDRSGRGYEQASSNECWLIKGPAFWHLGANNYGTPNRGGGVGVPVAGVSISGIDGKSMTLKLLRNAVEIARVTITFDSDAATLEALATLVQDRLTAAGVDWVECYTELGFPGMAIATVARETYIGLTPYQAVGPEVTLLIEGPAWDAIKMGTPSVTKGNVSQEYRAEYYDESNRHVARAVADVWPFDWRGVATLMYPQAEVGSGMDGGVNILHSYDNHVDHFSNSKLPMTGGFSGDTRPTLSLEARDDFSFSGLGMTALQLKAADTVYGYAKHGGELGIRQLRHQVVDSEGGARGQDALGNTGTRPPLLYSGPIGIKTDEVSELPTSWECHALTLLVGNGDTIDKVRTEFDSTANTVAAIATAIDTRLTVTGFTWLRCTPDASGTGFVVFVDEEALAGTPGNPQYHERTFVAIDPKGTTLTDPHARDRDTVDKLLQSYYRPDIIPAGPLTLAPHLEGATSLGEVRGATGGLAETVAAGRRLRAPRHQDDGGESTDGPLFEEVVWEEVVGSIKHLVEPPTRGALGPRTGQGEEQPENLIFYGGRERGEGRLLLYQFGSEIGTDFEEGERITFNSSDLSGGGTASEAYIRDPYQVSGPKSVVSRDNLVPFVPGGFASKIIGDVGTQGFNPGGSRVVGSTSLAAAYYNPVLIRVADLVAEPVWSPGDDLTSAFGAEGRFGTRFQVSALLGFGLVTETWYVVYGSTDSWASTVPDQTHRNVWSGELTSSDHPGFSGQVLDVIHLDSNVYSGGNLKPVMALSPRSHNLNDRVLGKPAVHSFGDVTVPHKGDFVFRDAIPSDDLFPDRRRRYWVAVGTETGVPTLNEVVQTTGTIPETTKTGVLIDNPVVGTWEIQQTSGAPITTEDEWQGLDSGATLTEVTDVEHLDSALDAARAAQQGRAFTTEMLVEDGRVIQANPAGDMVYPQQTRGLDQDLTIPTAVLARGSSQLVDGFGSGALSGDHQGVYQETIVEPEFVDTDEGVATMVFHPKIPSGFVWIEGFGAYLEHEQSGILARTPAVVALFALGAQSKEGIIPNYWGGAGSVVDSALRKDGYIHRLEVHDTGANVVRVDSAGGGMAGHDVTSPVDHAPSWADAGDGKRWTPFRPFLVFPHNEKTLELYVDNIQDTEPQAGMVISVGSTTGGQARYPGGMLKTGVIQYVEKYGSSVVTGGGVVKTITSYRLFVLPSDPIDLGVYPWDLFAPGERVIWDLTSEFGAPGSGIVRHTASYPHGMNLRIKVHLVASRPDGFVNNQKVDKLAGVYLRYRTDRVDLSRI